MHVLGTYYPLRQPSHTCDMNAGAVVDGGVGDDSALFTSGTVANETRRATIVLNIKVP